MYRMERWCAPGAMQKSISLGVLYFVQGLPYGFQDKLIPLLLIARGHSPSAVAVTRLLLLPWLVKPLFAPLIDTTLTKTKWVSGTILSLAAISLLNAFLGEYEDWSRDTISPQLSITLFVLNLFSAIQDIAVDAIAIIVLSSDDEISSGNAAQIVGYKLGAFFGSGVLYWIYASFAWSGLFSALFAVYALVFAVFVQIVRPRLRAAEQFAQKCAKKEDSNARDLNSKDSKLKNLNLKNSNSKDLNLKDLNNSVHPTSTSIADADAANLDASTSHHGAQSSKVIRLIAYLSLYKLGESAACATFPFYLISSAGVTGSSIAFWNGTIATLCSIFGSSIASRLPLSRLPLMLKLRLLPLLMQLLLVSCGEWHIDEHPSLYYLAIVSLIWLHMIGGAVTTLTFSRMMCTCQSLPESFRATRYTLLSSVELLPKLLFASLSGVCVDSAGYPGAMFAFVVLSILPIYFARNTNANANNQRNTGDKTEKKLN